jgi:hypothetical protein
VIVTSALAFTLLTRAHAHNDYEHTRPLEEALENGYCSIEPDIFLVDGVLLVGHNRASLKPTRTLKGMYLEPLAKRIKENKGWVYKGQRQTVQLLIDIKADPAGVYKALKQELAPYWNLLTSYDAKRPRVRALSIILSGERPIEEVKNEKDRRMAIDGRLPDLADPPSSYYIPLISADYEASFKTDKSPLSSEGHAQLVAWANLAHAQGRKIRFWGTPDSLEAWQEQWEAGADYISTDRLAEVRAFILGKG